VSRRAFQQFSLDQIHLILTQTAFPASPGRPMDRIGIGVEPITVPTANALTANLQDCCDGCLPLALLE
jgi:hypothetical protein